MNSLIKFWDDTDKDGFHAKCEYNTETRLYIVTVEKNGITKEETFMSGWEPRFGMDVYDLNRSTEIAEKLATEIEHELG